MRNLATIRKIKAVNNIDGYDKISKALKKDAKLVEELRLIREKLYKS